MSSEPSTARPLAVWVRIQDQDFLWTPGEGLDPAAATTVENWIWKRARAQSRVAAMVGLAVDDLVQEGRIGALRAARTYEPGHAANFLTWAVYWIRNAMVDALDGSGDINIPRDLRRTFRRNGQQPPVFSLDAVVPGSPENGPNATTWAALLPSDPEPTDELGQRARMALRGALETLRAQDREVILRRFGFRGEPETLEAIAKDWRLSRQRISQIESRARLRLRAALSPQPTPRAPTHTTRPSQGQKGPAMPKTARGAKPATKPTHQHGTQLTIEGCIRERERQASQHRRETTAAARAAKKARKDATKGTPLIELEAAP